MKLSLFAVALLATPFTAHAEQLIGIESDTDSPELAAEPAEVATQSTVERSARHDATSRPWESGGITIASGLHGAASDVGGQLAVSYGFNRYFAIDTVGHYMRYEKGTRIGEHYGPEIDAVVRYPNPTILTPFAGAGPGYVKWRREYNEQMFDDGASFTANAYAGLAIRFSKNFGVQGNRRQTIYLGELPIAFADQGKRDGRILITNNFGFFMAF